MTETNEQWRQRLSAPCPNCVHRLMSHNSEEHPRAPFACRICSCKTFEKSRKRKKAVIA